ncbi:MAG: hypothetical protein JNL05_11230 [Flavobacteriales bacterium]|nr:hypothetical protein [Flavobacteriales bacterium]
MFHTSEPVELNLHAFSNWTEERYNAFVSAGGRFVTYRYTVAVVIYRMDHPSGVHFVNGRTQAILRGIPYSLLSVLAGWWFLPTGPIRTIQCLLTNLSGGHDVGADVLEHIRQQDPLYQYGMR